MSGISTHILDLSLGIAAPGVRVVLEREAASSDPKALWVTIADTHTDADGRVKNLLPPGQPPTPGVYRLRFEIGPYWTYQGVTPFHPNVEVVFTVTDPDRHHHIPLLVSPFGYTTYRGT